MTLQEIKAEIDAIETRRFYLAMKDRWTQEDFKLDRAWSKLVDDLWDLYFQIQLREEQ